MSIRRVQPSDWPEFYALAAKEGWKVPLFERWLFEESWSEFVQVFEEGCFGGLVTAVAYERSGWIGNLIVPRQLRGQGIGRRLFRTAVSTLEERGIASCWLTASVSGQPLYEKAGFVVVDQIERWVRNKGFGSGQSGDVKATEVETLLACDRGVWGENRQALLRRVSSEGQVFACDGSVALLQRGDDLQILGPWYSETQCPRANRQLLLQLLAATDPSVEVVVDILLSSPLRPLLAATGFRPVGCNQLMVKGRERIDLKTVVSLASLGSIG